MGFGAIPAVLSTGIPGNALRAFPGSFRNFSGISSGKCQPYWGYGPTMDPDPPTLAFLKKARENPEKSKGFSLCGTPKILGKERENAQKSKGNRKTKKARKSKKARIGGSVGVAQRVFGKPCFCPLPKRGRFDENGENDEFAFYALKTRVWLLTPLKTTKMTKMAGVTQEKAWFRKGRVCSSLSQGSHKPGLRTGRLGNCV